MTVQEGSLKKNQMIWDPSIIEPDKSSKIISIPYMFFSLYFFHICMKKVNNERFLEFGFF